MGRVSKPTVPLEPTPRPPRPRLSGAGVGGALSLGRGCDETFQPGVCEGGR